MYELKPVPFTKPSRQVLPQPVKPVPFMRRDFCRVLTDAGQLVLSQHVHDAFGAESGAQGDHSRVFVGDGPDEAGVRSERMAAHGGEGCVGLGFGDESDHFALVGDVEGVEAEELAGSADGAGDGDGALMDFHANLGGAGHLIECGAKATASEVAHGVEAGCRCEEGGAEFVKGGGVGAEIAAEFEALALGEDGDAVLAEGAVEQNAVAGADVGGGEADAGGDEADAGGVDEDAVAGAALDDFGVAGDDFNGAAAGGLGHGGDDAAEGFEGQAFLKDEARGEVFGDGSADGEVVDGAVD